MGRKEMYPWSELQNVGEYFVVPSDFKNHTYMRQIVINRNRMFQGHFRYATAEVSSGTVVFLAQVGGEELPFEAYYENGIMVSGRRVAKAGDATRAERIAKMSPDERLHFLPWWHDPRTGAVVVNARVMTEEDFEKYTSGREPYPGPNEPYPEHYVSANFRLSDRWDEDEEQPEDWEEPEEEYENEDSIPPEGGADSE